MDDSPDTPVCVTERSVTVTRVCDPERMDAEYVPERDGELLTAGAVCALLHVSRSHLPNLRARGTLRGYQLFPGGHWRYPSGQATLAEARAALRGSAVSR